MALSAKGIVNMPSTIPFTQGLLKHRLRQDGVRLGQRNFLTFTLTLLSIKKYA